MVDEILLINVKLGEQKLWVQKERQTERNEEAERKTPLTARVPNRENHRNTDILRLPT